MENQNNYKIIRSFDEIEIKSKCLLVFDMDETIVKYDGICKKWWKELFVVNYSILGNYDEADNKCLTIWKDHIKNTLPVHTDKNGFFNILDKAKKLNCVTMIVTARDLELEELTHAHLSHLNIFGIDVYFSCGKNKSITIKNVMSNFLHDNNEIIFVDDMDNNLNDVKNCFGEKVKCYKFVIDLNL